VGLEAPIPEAVRLALSAMGHRVAPLPPGSAGGGQAVMKLAKGWAAGSDPRKDRHGGPAGESGAGPRAQARALTHERPARTPPAGYVPSPGPYAFW